MEGPAEIHFGRKRSKIIVIKDDEPGSIGFAKPSYVFKEADHSAYIPVHRANGTDGIVKVSSFGGFGNFEKQSMFKSVDIKSDDKYTLCSNVLTLFWES